MKNYVTTSLETHLFFGRIMKEHSLFLLASLPAGETELRNRADWFRSEFEKALEKTVRLAGGAVGGAVLSSGEVVTEFTELAERQTMCLTGIPIDLAITQAEKNLWAGIPGCPGRGMVQQVQNLNRNILGLLNGLITLKERILKEVLSCNLYTTNYPLLIEHILREAKLYRQIISELERRGTVSPQNLKATEMFWNQIMMEHALFIRGLLDPDEKKLVRTAEGFAEDYRELLRLVKLQDDRASEGLTRRTLKETKRYSAFKAAGTEGILNCEIDSIILPLLADHVLREANHYIRILESGLVD